MNNVYYLKKYGDAQTVFAARFAAQLSCVCCTVYETVSVTPDTIKHTLIVAQKPTVSQTNTDIVEAVSKLGISRLNSVVMLHIVSM